jgi:beta-mannosidase
MTDEDIFGEDESISEFHTKHNPDLGTVSIYTFIRTFAEKLFGKFRSGADRFLKMQMLQCQWVRQSFELARRNKWFSSGILYWMFNDCWPAANGWSIVDYYACPKPAYYAFKRCASALIAAIDEKDGELAVYVCSDSISPKMGSGSLYVYDIKNGLTRVSYSFNFDVSRADTEVALRLPISDIAEYIDKDSIILCDITADSGECDRAYFIDNRYSDTSLTYESPEIVGEDEEYITVRADSFNPCAIIDTPYLLAENAFPIKAGEGKRIKKIKDLK